ncbi:MAG: substrate-binding domain-containing protein [Kiloniellales bacterium]
MMTTREVADYLRIREREVYDLVRRRRIPCSRVTGKWLFPKDLVDLWVVEHVEYQPQGRLGRPPPVVAGSHDPLLAWALRHSRSNLALLAGGSLDGLQRLGRGEAVLAGLHLLDSDTGEYNVDAVRRWLPGLDVVAVEWAGREQGLVLAAGNPRQVRLLDDLREKQVLVIRRQDEAGSELLFRRLLAQAGVEEAALRVAPQRARSESDLALTIFEGKADAGLAIAAAARRYRLDFLPLARERYDLVMRRRDYFEPPMQKLLGFAMTPEFAARAAEMGGYDISGLGRITFNGP